MFDIINKKNSTNILFPKYEVGDSIRISQVKVMFENGYLPNWSEETYKNNQGQGDNTSDLYTAKLEW